MTNGINRKVNGHKCQKCGHVAYLAEFIGNICPKCGSDKLRVACCAKTRRKGICPNPAMPNGRCDKHGGKTPAPGPTHPNYKHGRLSKYLPSQLATRFEAARSDPDLLSMTDDVALIDAMRSEVAQRLESGESGQTWKALREIWGDFRRGQRLQREAGAAETDELRNQLAAEARQIITDSLEAADRLITGGASEENRREELIEITNNLVSVKASENSRQNRAQTTMTAAEAALFLFQVQQALANEITDTETLRRVGFAFNYILQHGTAPPPRDLRVVEVPQLPAGLSEPAAPTANAVNAVEIPPPQAEEKRG